jgi:hypothetical protein
MRHRITRRLTILGATIALALAAPLGVALAAHFNDVPNSSVYHGDITALAATGVTVGCGGGNFCPKANVTREQMAAFMNRLGALGPGKTPVVNAKTAQTASNADKLDGLDSSAFARPLWAVVNANGSLARGVGAVSAGRVDGPTGTYAVVFNRAVTNCAYIGTIGLSGTVGSSPPGEITVVRRFDNSAAVHVETHNSAGLSADRGFHVSISCAGASGTLVLGQSQDGPTDSGRNGE